MSSEAKMWYVASVTLHRFRVLQRSTMIRQDCIVDVLCRKFITEVLL